MKCAVAIFLVASAVSATGESLNYSINWASGLSVGEGTLSSTKSSDPARPGWNLDLDLDASVPGFTVRDHYHSAANVDLCSTRLEKQSAHGLRKTKETVTLDQEKHLAKRETQGGGHSEFDIGLCARDALAFLVFVRKELEQGRLAPQQAVILGAQYQVHFEYTGVQRIPIVKTQNDKTPIDKTPNDKTQSDKTQSDKVMTEAECIKASITGPGSGITLELFFARDAARTPLLARIPLSVGTLTVELIR
jgi:hypothetical protein